MSENKKEYRPDEQGTLEYVQVKGIDQPASVSFKIYGRDFKLKLGADPNPDKDMTRSEANSVIAQSRTWDSFLRASKEMDAVMEEADIDKLGLTQGTFLRFLTLVEVGKRMAEAKRGNAQGGSKEGNQQQAQGGNAQGGSAA